jgi:hypothetical protein
MSKKYWLLWGIIGGLLLFFLVKGFLEHIRFHKQDYKSAEHVYAGKYCVVTIPENWKDSLHMQSDSEGFIHLESGSHEASIDIAVNSSAGDTIKDPDEFESPFRQRFFDKYSKTHFSKFGNYQGRGLLMTGKIQNRQEGYVKIFIHVDSVQSLFVVECNTAPGSKQVGDDLQQIESSFKLK